jgi:ribulose bisphosphate carboxylase small subunit
MKMSKYQVEYTLEKWYRVTIEAESPEDARTKFWAGDYESEEQEFGSEIQDSVEITEQSTND